MNSVIFRRIFPVIFALVILNRHIQVAHATDPQSATVEINTNNTTSNQRCYCYPGDSCWPSTSEWQQFNKTLGGKLVATVPIGSVCHRSQDPSFTDYDANACSKLQAAWFSEKIHYESSSSVMAPFFANQSCDPFLPPDSPCVVGTYIQYAVNATSAFEYTETISFVKRHNIRLVIRNTGHDYNGKSTGAGAVGIWTHYIKSMEFIDDYKSNGYSGKAMKLGAGVQSFEAYAAAKSHGFVIVGGNGPTVGLAGGYTQGGGHGPLASKFGLAADQVLEWEVVIATGELLHVSPSKNEDLYWALCGGGGGTFGVVLSITVKAYQDLPMTASSLNFTSDGVSQDSYYDVISVFHEILIPLVDAGGVSNYQFTSSSFTMAPAYGPSLSKAQMDSIFQPVIKALTQYNIKYTYISNEYSNFLDGYNAMNPPIPTEVLQIGSRLVPRSLILTNNSALRAAVRTINSKGGGIAGLALNAVKLPGMAPNAVNPAWRDTLFNAVIYTLFNYTNWEENLANQELMTTELVPELTRLTPGGGAYLNEADFRQPDYKEAFYGSNYAQLEFIKNKYDPTHIFYSITSVGSEHWMTGLDGRLCRV